MKDEQAQQRWRRPGLGGPIILIAAGLVLLLANLGLLRVDLWQIWRLWPLLLILIGLDILVRDSRWGSVVVGLVAVALVSGVLLLMVTVPAPPDASPRQVLARQVSEELGAAKEVDVTIRMSLGDLRLEALQDSGNLFEGSLNYPERGGSLPYVSYEVSGERGRLVLEGRSSNTWVVPFFTPPEGDRWTVRLNRRVPLNLDVDPGASTSLLDLSQLQVKDLRVRGGVGRMEIVFPPESAGMTARVEGGVGEVVLRIPEGLAARIQVDGGLGAVNVDSRFEQHGNVYQTRDDGTAGNRLDVHVDGGVGCIRVQ